MSTYLRQRIDEKKEGFSKSFRMIVEFIESHPSEIAFRPIQDISREMKISTATMYRFCQEIGLSGYTELQREIQEEISQDYRLRSFVPDEEDSLSGILVSQARRNIRILEELISDNRELGENIVKAAHELISARRIYILGLQGDFGQAHSLYFNLVGLHDDVHLMQMGAGFMNDELKGITSSDVLLIVSFSVYQWQLLEIAQQFVMKNAKIISISDENSPVVPLSFVSLIPKHETPSFGSVLKVTISRALVVTITRLQLENRNGSEAAGII